MWNLRITCAWISPLCNLLAIPWRVGFTASTFPKSMLVATEDTIGFKVAHDATVDDMFQALACH